MSYYEERKKILKERIRLSQINNDVLKQREARGRMEELQEYHDALGKEAKSEAAPKKEKKLKKDDFDDYTVADMKELAKDLGVEGYSTMRRSELIDVLKQA